MKPKRLFSPEVKRLISRRAAAKHKRDLAQRHLLEDRALNKLQIEGKLTNLVNSTQFYNFQRCGEEHLYRICSCCGRRTEFLYRCSLKWCPLCNWRITDDRRVKLRAWLRFVRQPKHLVLTQRNFPILTRRKIRAFTCALASLRRKKIFSRVQGGCASIEITNDGRGWHLHAHLLLDASWVDMKKLSLVWGKLVGQEFGIVKIRDCRNEEFLQEVSKYVVKGSTMAAWPGDQINEFVRAIKGLRFFFAFGSLFHLRGKIRAILNSQKPDSPVCDCGSSKFLFKSETDIQLEEIRRNLLINSRIRKSKPSKPQKLPVPELNL